MTTTQTTFDSASPDGATLDRATFDGAKAEAFGGRMMSILTGSLLSSMVDIGHRTGLFAAAAEGAATSEQLAVARLTVATPFDVVFVFDALHDQVDPGAMLARIHDALVPGGLLFMREPHAADTLAGNLANPMAPVFYSISTLHCLTVSLAHGGAGIGSAFGEQLARRMLTEAGFGPADVHPAPGHPFERGLRHPHRTLTHGVRVTTRTPPRRSAR